MTNAKNTLPEDLHLLDLPLPRTGFHNFISSWFFTDIRGRRILVDPGPAVSLPSLIRQLALLTDDVDLVLLTHIHLDHSGGVAQFHQAYPNAKVLVHPKGGKHLLNPQKLWTASLETLGDIAVNYGEPLPLPPEALADNHGPEGIDITETPGHAPHHLAFSASLENGERIFFVGESAGLYLPSASTPEHPYLRPTTPPRFDASAARASLSRIARSLRGDEWLCYSHWGAARDPKRMIELATAQLDRWIDIISPMRDRPVKEILNRLLSADPLLRAWPDLPEELRERELIFITTSIQGILSDI